MQPGRVRYRGAAIGLAAHGRRADGVPVRSPERAAGKADTAYGMLQLLRLQNVSAQARD